MKELTKTNGGTVTRQSEGTVGAWTPWSEVSELRRRMDDVFSRAFGYTPLSRFIPSDLQIAEPEVDVHETDEAMHVVAAMPGFTLEQIDVQAANNCITIEAERKALVDEDKARTHHANGPSAARRFYFTYTMPVDIDPKRVKATFANGVLNLDMPKTEQARAKTVKVNIQAA